MRILLDVTSNERTCQGTLSVEGSDQTSWFSGWFELLALLEAQIGAPIQNSSLRTQL